MTTLPATLARFQAELEGAISRELAQRRARRVRRLTLRLVVAGGVAGAVALGVLSALPGDKASAVERAAAALGLANKSILHVKVVSALRTYDGRVQMYRSESWEESSKPFRRREITERDIPDEPGLEGGRVVNGRRLFRLERAGVGFAGDMFYDPRKDTIFILEPQPTPPDPASCAVEGTATARQLRDCHYPSFAPGPELGTVRVTSLTRLNNSKPFRYRVGNNVISEREAKRIRDRRIPTEPPPEFHRHRILELLKRTDVQTHGRVRVRGREALRIVWNAGHSVYLVDARTYNPIELRETNKSGTRTTRFLVYQRLPLNKTTRALVDLKAQHPTARVTHNPSAYRAAILPFVPHG